MVYELLLGWVWELMLRSELLWAWGRVSVWA